MSLTCGARSIVNIDRSTVNTNRVRTGPVGPRYGLDLGRAGPDTWHAVTQPCHDLRPPLGFIHSSAHTAWLTVDLCSWSMDRRLGPRWTESTLPSFGMVYVHQVQARAAGEGSPLFPSPMCSCRWFAHRRAPTAVLASNYGGEKLRQVSANTMVGSRWWPGLPRVLATVVGGLVTAVLAGGVARGCSRGPGALFPFIWIAGDREECRR